MPQFLVAAIALCVVLALIAALSWLVRRAPGLLPPAQAVGMVLRGSLRIDARRRLHLVEVGGQQALVLTGGATDTIICLPPPAA